jgi:oxazoline/thiazoline synthase
VPLSSIFARVRLNCVCGANIEQHRLLKTSDGDADLSRQQVGRRAGEMTADLSSLSDFSRRAEQEGNGEIRFSPNFSAYVLPPDVVCLYSENRKVFLRGELYRAIVSRIGIGERREALVSALSGEFPAAKIEEALKRLTNRGFVVSENLIGRVAAGYWATHGLDVESATENLAKIGVRIEPFAAAGARELDAALHEFGVRVADQSPGLTVVLVDDYLDSRLADFNRERLAQKQDWLLVQPSGVFPLIGPIFSRGKSACWTCLADRMKWNRQIKAFLDRKEARCVAASPLNENVLARSAIGVAAIEIAKAVASDFHTDLRDHVVSLDLLASTIVRHHVPARPQCPSCGSMELRDPSRAPLPTRLRVGGTMVTTSRGYRSMAPAETVARFRKLVSPLTGAVSQLDRIKSGQPADASFVARYSFAPRPEVLDAPQARLIGESCGNGVTAEESEASALMQGIERYCGIFHGDEIRMTRRFADFPAGDAILPNDILLLSEAQYAQGSEGLGRFDASTEMEWSPVWSLRDERFKYLPTSLLYFFYRGLAAYNHHADSNGCAAGNTLAEAIVQGFLELVERDAYAIWWYNQSQRRQVDLDQFDDSYIRDLRYQLAETGRRLWVLDVTSDLAIPSFVAITHWMDEGRENIEFGSGAHFDARIALLRALTELNQFLSIGLMGGGKADKSSLDGTTPLRLQDHPFLTPSDEPPIRPASVAKFGGLDTREQVTACVSLAKRAGLDFLVLDQTRPDVEVPVVRVIVPGLRHFYRRFAPGRLYDVPVKLGLRERPLSEDELNPAHPHT